MDSEGPDSAPKPIGRKIRHRHHKKGEKEEKGEKGEREIPFGDEPGQEWDGGPKGRRRERGEKGGKGEEVGKEGSWRRKGIAGGVLGGAGLMTSFGVLLWYLSRMEAVAQVIKIGTSAAQKTYVIISTNEPIKKGMVWIGKRMAKRVFLYQSFPLSFSGFFFCFWLVKKRVGGFLFPLFHRNEAELLEKEHSRQKALLSSEKEAQREQILQKSASYSLPRRLLTHLSLFFKSLGSPEIPGKQRLPKMASFPFIISFLGLPVTAGFSLSSWAMFDRLELGMVRWNLFALAAGILLVEGANDGIL